MWIVGYGCSTVAGAGRKNLFSRLASGESLPVTIHDSGLIKNKTEALPDYRVHLRSDLPKNISTRQRLQKKLEDSWNDLQEVAPAKSISELNSKRTGIILASTKGFIEDVVWKDGLPSVSEMDTLTPIMDDFLAMTKIKPVRRMVVSNACSSVAAALKLAQSWFDAKAVDNVVVISADTVGEFVVRGFHSLQALTPHSLATPFDQNRAGLQLGEAAAVLLLSSIPESQLRLRGVGINCEGVAATRPDEEGRSLFLALDEVLKGADKPSAIVAHGTGTPLNDSTEDFVFNSIYSDSSSPSITGSKWCTGHTLGVSAAIDLIAATQILENKKIYGLANTKKVDPKFKGHYVLKTADFAGSSVLISSLGFGGVHAGLLLTKESN